MLILVLALFPPSGYDRLMTDEKLTPADPEDLATGSPSR
jgi:hypothetical protein